MVARGKKDKPFKQPKPKEPINEDCLNISVDNVPLGNAL